MSSSWRRVLDSEQMPYGTVHIGGLYLCKFGDK